MAIVDVKDMIFMTDEDNSSFTADKARALSNKAKRDTFANSKEGKRLLHLIKVTAEEGKTSTYALYNTELKAKSIANELLKLGYTTEVVDVTRVISSYCVYISW